MSCTFDIFLICELIADQYKTSLALCLHFFMPRLDMCVILNLSDGRPWGKNIFSPLPWW